VAQTCRLLACLRPAHPEGRLYVDKKRWHVCATPRILPNMAFPEREAGQLLAACHRRCCICHRSCGVKMELAHIEQRSETCDDGIENAIPVCFECHAEIGLYNPKHPRGRRFSPAELRLHRDQWLQICRERPEALLDAPVVSDAGTIERLIHEMEFNLEIASQSAIREVGCPFEVTQFERAITDGTYSILTGELRKKLRTAYLMMKRANTYIAGLVATTPEGNAGAMASNRAQFAVADALQSIKGALDALSIPRG